MLRIKKLEKTYSSGVHALRDVSLDVPAGMFGLLGPNGAGKTTLMKILATLLEPDSGTAEMNDVDLIVDKHGARRCLVTCRRSLDSIPHLRLSKRFITLQN